MLTIKKLSEVHGNNVVIYSLQTLLDRNTFPHFTILSGHMGVGKTTVANIIAESLHDAESTVRVFNFGLDTDMRELEETVFKLNPAVRHCFVFEELHGLDKSQQTALLTMLDKQPENVYIIATTTEIHKILRTIRSRAQVFDFKLLSNKQLSQLLDNYLRDNNISTMSMEAKNALINSARGVPRDLLKNTDLAIAGEFGSKELSELLGQVSEDLIFSLLCTLKSSSVDFYITITTFMGVSNKDKLSQIRDFYTRYLLERRGIEGSTISKERIKVLDSLFSFDELNQIGKTLLHATEDTLILELTVLNMELTHVGNRQLVGQQIDRLARQTATATAKSAQQNETEKLNKAKVSATSLHELKFK